MNTPDFPRRAALTQAARLLAAIAVVTAGMPAVHAAEKKKAKAAKEDFFFQDTPGEKGRSCGSCVNFEPGAGDKGTCAIIEGEVCKTCFCQAWSDKKAGKKAAA
jgi:hypothetical protein